MAYIYQADVFCDTCGHEICERLREEGKASTDADIENERYDSEDWPKSACDDDETDCPQHCGSHDDCLEAEILPSGRRIGCLIGTNLTPDGVEYVREAIAEGGEVAEFWADQFSAYF